VSIPPLKVVFGEEDIRDIQGKMQEVLTTGMLAQGKYVNEFEEKWAHTQAQSTLSRSTLGAAPSKYRCESWTSSVKRC